MAKADEINLVPVKAGKSKLTLVLIVLLVLMTGAAGFFGWRQFAGSAATPTHTEESAPAEETAEEPESGHEPAGAKGEHGNQSAILNFEPFLVNLADRDASRYLRITIRLQVANKGVAEKITSAEALTSQMRDAILSTLATRVADQIVTPEGKELLKVEIAEKLNVFLPGKPVKAVFFTDFVIQL